MVIPDPNPNTVPLPEMVHEFHAHVPEKQECALQLYHHRHL